jgi:hypothetical protein
MTGVSNSRSRLCGLALLRAGAALALAAQAQVAGRGELGYVMSRGKSANSARDAKTAEITKANLVLAIRDGLNSMTLGA